MKKLIPFAIIYDFDGTLAPGNMQERAFIPSIGMSKKKFWAEVLEQSKKHEADEILVYMQLMLKKADSSSVKVSKKDFKKCGEKITFFDGILENLEKEKKGWFQRINDYGKESGIKIEHYIISSGIKEMITGTPISKKFKKIYASSFRYSHNGIAEWPALAINYTTKTQYLFRINKGCLDINDKETINEYIPENERIIPFSNMIYIGDGETDIPCFRLVKDRGGNSIAVYRPNTSGAKAKVDKLKKEGRINFSAAADYSEGKQIDKIVKAIIEKIQTDNYLNSF